MKTAKRNIIQLLIFSLALTNLLSILEVEQTAYGEVLGTQDIRDNIELSKVTQEEDLIKLRTQTAFDQKEENEEIEIPYETKYIEDDDLEYGTEKLIKEGEPGTKTLTYKITFWLDEEIDKQLIKTEVVEPKAEEIAKGTKIVWHEYQAPGIGKVWYWQKLKVWATKYDGNCYGCSGRTFSGTAVRKGVCAVDPKTIPLGTNFYVEGYGICRAEDIGGAIKGNKIDLGFEKASEGNWGAAYTNVYLLTNSPVGDGP